MSGGVTHGSLTSPDDDKVGEAVRRIQAYLDQLRQRGEPLPVNREEWDRFFRLHRPFLLRLVRRHHWSAEDCEDGVQELWLVLITRLPDLQYNPCRGEIRAWISTLVKHWLVDQDRYRRIHSMKQLGCKDMDQLAGREQDPAITVERIQLTERVPRGVGRTPHVCFGA